MSHTGKDWPLLHPDGSLTTEIVRSVRVSEGGVSMAPSINGALRGTAQSVLTTFAIRTTDVPSSCCWQVAPAMWIRSRNMREIRQKSANSRPHTAICRMRDAIKCVTWDFPLDL